MFEKVAEFYAREKYSPGTDSFIVAAAEDAFEDGATFGYKWANEWHYPSKGEYPRQYAHTRFSIYVLANNKKWVYYDFSSDKWFCVNKEVNVIAWKEIVFPKEIEEND